MFSGQMEVKLLAEVNEENSSARRKLFSEKAINIGTSQDNKKSFNDGLIQSAYIYTGNRDPKKFMTKFGFEDVSSSQQRVPKKDKLYS
mmetsp:Transcript_47048/g.34428  ORF Transcript_47048/g.34428 Transcript_47048/m.34428 type:complete len:88 (-) Transcript_47048:208-471(-)